MELNAKFIDLAKMGINN